MRASMSATSSADKDCSGGRCARSTPSSSGVPSGGSGSTLLVIISASHGTDLEAEEPDPVSKRVSASPLEERSRLDPELDNSSCQFLQPPGRANVLSDTQPVGHRGNHGVTPLSPQGSCKVVGQAVDLPGCWRREAAIRAESGPWRRQTDCQVT